MTLPINYFRKNFGYGTLNGSITISAVTMVVNSGNNFPLITSEFFKLIIWDAITFPNPADDPNLEVVTANYSGTLNHYTIDRGEESTSPVAHANGAACAMTITAGLSVADQSIIGSKVLDESGIGNKLPLTYDSGTGNVEYGAPYASGSYLVAGPSIIIKRGNTASPTKIIELVLTRNGTLSIVFGLILNGSSESVGQIYRNGVAVGTIRQNSTATWIDYTETISGWVAGDLLQLYAYNDLGSDGFIAGALRIYENSPIREFFSMGGIQNGFGPLVYSGPGAPNGGLGVVGDEYMRTDGTSTTTLYVKTDVSTWTPK